jgi:hypothetical protein
MLLLDMLSGYSAVMATLFAANNANSNRVTRLANILAVVSELEQFFDILRWLIKLDKFT